MRRGGTIGHLLVRAFERHADAEMLVGDGERLSYAQMAARTARMLRALADLGLGPGRRIALLSRNRIDVLAAAYAGYIGGLCVTPLSPLTSEDDLAFMLADAEIDALIVDDGAFGARGLAVKERVPGLRHLLSLGPLAGAVDLMAKAASSEPAPLLPRAQPGDLVVIGYTGGTTGRPKCRTRPACWRCRRRCSAAASTCCRPSMPMRCSTTSPPSASMRPSWSR